ncbi:hypothetical protein CEXT_778541 [Caerostris extrusa]|uniref:Uncharacterized protein n=1 Tax=Caerostris extrusa TaxID=172846 RepID=A0AAV4TJM5_CAEEX|nr:hypothetical protein CEXT_778541 [Caerostris extrusa]
MEARDVNIDSLVHGAALGRPADPRDAGRKTPSGATGAGRSTDLTGELAMSTKAAKVRVTRCVDNYAL